MRCRKAEKLINSYLDEGLDPRLGRALETHLAECAPCRALVGDLRGIVEEAAALGTPEPSTDLWPGILAGARAAREAPWARRDFPLPPFPGGKRRIRRCRPS